MWWKKIAYVFDRRQKAKALWLFIVIVIGAFVELVGVGAVLPFISAVLNPDELMDNAYIRFFYEQLHLRDTDQLIIALGVLIIVIYILKNIYVYLMHSMQYRFTYDNQRILSYRMMQCYVSQPYVFHLDHNSAELSRNINEDVTSFFEAILAGLQFASEGSVCLALLVFLAFQDIVITIGTLGLIGLFGYLFLFVFRKRLRRAGRKGRNSQADTRQTVLETLRSIKEIKILDREQSFLNTYDEQYRGFAESYRKFKVYSMIPKPVMETIVISGLLVIICVKVMLGTDPSAFIPTMSIFAVAAFRMLPSANRIAEYLSRIIFSRPAIDSIYHDLKAIEELIGHRLSAAPSEESGAKAVEMESLPFERAVEVKDLSFRYPSAQHDVLHDVNIEIPKNKSVAFVGPSGQGKTTMADVILGLLTPQHGGVYVDGKDIRENLGAWHQKLGYIPQTIALLDASIRENILFGIPAEEVSEERLQSAVREAQLADFINSLEEGLDTVIGESGVRLSGGQRQRIGIARALYHNPDFLVLDEATSALDNETEAAVMEAIDYLAGSKTLLIIAHRLSTIANCDIVYKVDQGTVTRDK
ncbi:MAG: ABC transporter ATP-binding protein [Lachnospiraceae bacterium]|nr:ABC transporter ATP-binding protein [Lachnospiraceae bacterium]